MTTMQTRISEYVLANLASMSVTVRRRMPVLLLYSSFAVAEAENIAECKSYYVLPRAPDKDTAERARDVLHERGWRDFDPPKGLSMPSISLSPPAHSSVHTTKETSQFRFVGSATSNESSHPREGEAEQEIASVAEREEAVLEHFDGFVDYIEDEIGFFRLKRAGS